MNEGELLEMANTLKTKFEDLENKEKLLEIQMLEFTKSLCGIYGLIRLLDNMIIYYLNKLILIKVQLFHSLLHIRFFELKTYPHFVLLLLCLTYDLV